MLRYLHFKETKIKLEIELTLLLLALTSLQNAFSA